MNLDNANAGLIGFSSGLNSFTTWLSKITTWMFTFKNMMFFGIIIAIIFIAWKLFENDVNRKKYFSNRRREL